MAFNQIAYQSKYNKENYDQIVVMVPKGERDNIKEIAKKRGKSVGEYVRNLIKEDNKIIKYTCAGRYTLMRIHTNAYNMITSYDGERLAYITDSENVMTDDIKLEDIGIDYIQNWEYQSVAPDEVEGYLNLDGGKDRSEIIEKMERGTYIVYEIDQEGGGCDPIKGTYDTLGAAIAAAKYFTDGKTVYEVANTDDYMEGNYTPIFKTK